MYHRGHPNRHLRGLRLSRRRPSRATARRRGGKDVGRITSAARLPALGPIALAMVRREVEPGDEVSVGAGRPGATVVELPFASERARQDPGSARMRARSCPTRRRTAVESRRATQIERRRFLSSESPLLGGPLPAEAGAEEPRAATVAYDADADVYRLPDAESRRREPRRCATSQPAAGARPRPPGRRLGPLGARLPARSSRCSTSTTGTGSGSTSRASSTCPPPAARCSPPTTPARCRRTRR